MSTLRRIPLLLLAAVLLPLGCHAQLLNQSAAQPGTPLTPELARRVEVLLRQKAQLPPESTINLGPRIPSDFPGYDTISVSFTSEGNTSHPLNFLLSADGKTLAQLSKFDISANPRDLVSPEGRPFRGGIDKAPVLIVGFDDLECPYCARIHAELFPALLQRYGNMVHFVYKDFPLPADMHPWAMHAAVDVNCLAAQSHDGYWNVVDYIHSHASEIGVPPPSSDPKAPKDKTLAVAEEQLDRIIRDQGVAQKVDLPRLNDCLTKQDKSGIEASVKVGEALHVDSTPALFINGDKIDGAVPLEFIFGIIDNALRVEGIPPPPPYIAPKAAEPAAAPAAQSTAKPGN